MHVSVIVTVDRYVRVFKRVIHPEIKIMILFIVQNPFAVIICTGTQMENFYTFYKHICITLFHTILHLLSPKKPKSPRKQKNKQKKTYKSSPCFLCSIFWVIESHTKNLVWRTHQIISSYLNWIIELMNESFWIVQNILAQKNHLFTDLFLEFSWLIQWLFCSGSPVKDLLKEILSVNKMLHFSL